MNAVLMILARATLLLSVSALAVLILHRYGASVRHAIWTAGLVTLLVLPLTELAVPKVDIPVLPNGPVVAPEDVQAFIDQLPPGDDAPPPAPDVSGGVPAGPPAATDGGSLFPDWPLTRWLWIGWVAGVLVMLARLALGSWFLHRLIARSTIAPGPEWNAILGELLKQFAIRTVTSVRISAEDAPPMTRGLRSHTIVLPSTAADWSSDKRRLVLAHELAHVKRRDGLTQALGQIALTLYWFHPLAWYAAHRSRIEREQAADAEVLRLGGDTTAYAEHLLATVGQLENGLAFTTVSIARPSELDGRLAAMFNTLPPNGSERRLIRWASIAVLVLTLAASVLTLTRRPAFEFRDPVDVTRQVVSLQTGEPVPNATIRLAVERRTDDWEPALEAVPRLGQWLDTLRHEARSDANGQVTFTGVTPAHYVVTALAEGFLPASSPRLISVDDGGTADPEPIGLTREARISGRVLDAEGRGVADVAVSLLALPYVTGDRPTAAIWGTPQQFFTDASGEYDIAASPDSEYLVRARTRYGGDYPDIPSSVLPLYAPGVSFPDEALRLAPEPGDHLTGVDLVFPVADYHRVTLNVTLQDVPPDAEIQFWIRPASNSLVQQGPIPFPDGGPVRVFRFDRIGQDAYRSPWLVPGTYEIVVWAYFAGRPLEELASEIRTLTVTVVDQDITQEMVLGPPRSMPVRVLGPPDAVARAVEEGFWLDVGRVWPPHEGGGRTNAPGTPDPELDGAILEIGDIGPGEHSAGYGNLPQGLSIERVSYGGQDLTNSFPFRVFHVDDSVGTLEVVLGTNTGSLSGTVEDLAGRPVARASLSILRADALDEPHVARFRADAEGQFETQPPPGEYLLHAADVYEEAMPSHEWLRQRADQLVRVTVEAGEETIADVPLFGP